jgi:hypothetical protein
VAVAIDLLTEDESLLTAMRKLAADAKLRDSLAAAGFDHWSRHHRLELMADDYRRVLKRAAALPAPRPDGLPRHLIQDHGELSRSIARRFGVALPFE